MSTPIRILIVDDSEDDAKLALRALRGGGFEPTSRRVQTAADLAAALSQERWDAVISDFKMPGFTGMDALEIFHSTALDIPFILTSGTIGESTAVDAMKAGASDYIMKKDLARLAPALQRELKETRLRIAHRRAQEELTDSERRFRQLAENISDVFFLQNLDSSQVYYVSPAYEQVTGRTCESLYADPASWMASVHPDDFDYATRKTIEGRAKGYDYELRLVRADGAVRCIHLRGFPILDDAGNPYRIAGIATDVTARKDADAKIKRLNRVYAVLSGIKSVIVRVRERDELFREACRIAVQSGQFLLAWVGVVDPAAHRVKAVAWAGDESGFVHLPRTTVDAGGQARSSGLGAQAIESLKPAICNDIERDPGSMVYAKEALARGYRSAAALPLAVGGKAVGALVLYAAEAGFFDDEEMKLLLELGGDIALALDHIEKAEKVNYLAYYDALTGLANRSLFLERVAQHIRGAERGGHKLALYLIDLDRFKSINDSLGQMAGDDLLRQVAEWLTHNVGGATLAARLGSDHFAVVVPEAGPHGDVARIVEKAIETFLEHSFRLNDTVFRLAFKAGVAVFPDDGADADILFRNAEAALKKAKADGDRYLFYTRKMTEMVAGRLTLENRLRQALEREEFVLHYQPKVSLATGKVTGAEALIRWNDPVTGLVPPMRFIPILEETGLIHEVGRWALGKAIEDHLRWCGAGLAAVRIAVNVSPLQLRARGFAAEIEQAIDVDARAAAGLELEITESVIMEDIADNIANLKVIRGLGVTIAIDDFGTGFSSLSYLAKLPVDTLKIDRSFVVDMTRGPEGLALVSTIIKLAHSLKLKVVAEGVETEDQSGLLRLLDCDEMQGYLFSRPVTAQTFEETFLRPSLASDAPICLAAD